MKKPLETTYIYVIQIRSFDGFQTNRCVTIVCSSLIWRLGLDVYECLQNDSRPCVKTSLQSVSCNSVFFQNLESGFRHVRYVHKTILVVASRIVNHEFLTRQSERDSDKVPLPLLFP